MASLVVRSWLRVGRVAVQRGCLSTGLGGKRYTEQHEWVSAGSARVGITKYAAEALGEIVFVQLPEEGTT